MLYPLKFKPILKEQIWGGDKLIKAGKKLPRNMKSGTPVGESWELSGVKRNISIAENGFLKSNNLQELIEVYMGDLVGDEVYEKFGLEFPVLVKFIDASEKLSVQVHPGDDLAFERHGTRGKTEMWYVIDTEPGASLYVGFNRPVSRAEYQDAVAENRLGELLQHFEVKKGDSFYIPAGTVHAIGEGVLVAEIQETSDITYRIDDWGRVDADGKPRKLHIADAADAIDFGHYDTAYRCTASGQPSGSVRNLVSSPYFITNFIKAADDVIRNYAVLDSFVILICTEGNCVVSYDGGEESLTALNTLLIPADIDEITISGAADLLEVFIG